MKNLLAIIVVLFATIAVAKEKKNSENKYPNSYYIKQFERVFEHIQKEYVKEPDYQEMTDEAIHGMLRSLDPYSSYYTEEDMEMFIDQVDGEFGGIGVEIIYDSNAILVITPIDDLPAYKAGIRAGDYILGVNGQLVSTLGFHKSVNEMRGEPGTKLNLLVFKEDDGRPKEVELERQIVQIKPIKYEAEFDDSGVIGYIRIVTFNEKTTRDLKAAVKDIEKQALAKNDKLRGIILDVRSNPGGLLEQAAEVSEYFLKSGTIVTAKGKSKSQDMVYAASRYSQKAPDVPVVVLINAGSASAAEIVAGALQDNNRAILLGTTTYGKGLVQTFRQINKRAAIKLTTQKYFTPSGRSINAKGIDPDVYIEPAKVEFAEKDKTDRKFSSSSIKAYLKKYNKDEEEEGKDQDKSKNGKNKAVKPNKSDRELSKKYKSDYQYARAYDLLRGLIINNNKVDHAK